MLNTRIPVTVLTGFLGAGKTTLLKRIIQENTPTQRIAIIENEFSDEGIDQDLLFVSGDPLIVETINGCICCKVRADLAKTLEQLRRKRESGELMFDRVIIETTGLADPAPVAQTFFTESAIERSYVLDAILTVVDAAHADTQIAEHVEAQEQIGIADRVLVTKTDLIDELQLKSVLRRIRHLNPDAPIVLGANLSAALPPLLDLQSFNLGAVLEKEPDFLGDHEHEHDDDVGAVVFTSDIPMDRVRVANFIASFLSERASDLLRYKGILHIEGEPRRVVLQGVHMINAMDFGRRWNPGERQRTRLVFIGRDLPGEQIRRALRQCEAMSLQPH